MAVVVITVGVIAVIMAMGVAAVMVITPGKGSKENPKKSSPRRKGGFPLGLPMQKRARVGVIRAPLDISPAQKG